MGRQPTQNEIKRAKEILSRSSNVKKIRESKGFTQMQLAHAIGHSSVGHIAKAELHKYDKHFSIENLYKIAKVLDTPIEKFFTQIEK